MTDGYTGEEKRHLPRTPVSDISFNRYGYTTTRRQSKATVGTSVSRIIGISPNRISLLITNNSDTVVYVGYDSEVSTTNGIPLSAAGGSLELKIDYEGEAVTGDFWAVCGSAGKVITLLETVIGGG